MSTTYANLPFTSFPDAVQQFPLMQNILATDGANVKGFQEAMESGDTVTAQQYYAQIVNADKKFITSDMLNTLFQTCVALEQFFTTDVKPYIVTKQNEWQGIIDQMDYAGIYSVTKQYVKNNYVTYNGLIYIATETPPIGTYPNNTAYWRQLTIQGTPGESGVGMSFIGEWSATQNYSINDAVSYGTGLWGASVANINQIPAEGSAYWTLIYRNVPTVYPVQAATPVGQQVNDLWFEVTS